MTAQMIVGGEAPREDPTARAQLAQFGMWVFIASEVLFFGSLLFAYMYGRTHWSHGFGEASRHTDVVLGTLNTGILLVSSALIAFALACAEFESRRRWLAPVLALTAALGTAFLVVKGMEYHSEWQEGLFPGPGFELSDTSGAELFFMLYFVLTGVHALHLLIGVVGVGAFTVGSWRHAAWVVPRRVEVMALYWHFVDIVWIFLYPLLYLVERHS